ncbi:MAG: hypothetical protein J6S67_19775 [Methanobrevibacter sp.]|nr:hypothetical protein [Methanobrevibacter sp.]
MAFEDYSFIPALNCVGIIKNTYGCFQDDEYKTNPIFEGYEGTGEGAPVVVYDHIAEAANLETWGSTRHAMWIRQDHYPGPPEYDTEWPYSAYFSTPYSNFNFTVMFDQEHGGLTGTYTYPAFGSPYTQFTTNIPIFLDIEDAQDYLMAATEAEAHRIMTRAINYQLPEELEGYEFEITNPWQHGTWTAYGPTPDTAIAYRNVRGKILDGGRMAFYEVAGISDGSLKLNFVSSGTFEALEYSVDGVTWNNTTTFPFSFFYRKRTDETGTFNYGLAFSNNSVPIYRTQEEATDYLQGLIDETEALNWSEISDSYPTKNGTGEPDDITEFGSVYTRSFFTQQYICDTNAIQDISNALYDITPGGMWEDIKKGLDMFGGNPMDAVVSLMYYPLNLTTVFTQVESAPSIWFGGYEHQLSQGTASKILFPDGSFSVGTVAIKPTFKNWRDVYATKLFVDLPYCGRYELDPTKYYNKTVEVRYFIDTHTGGCVACLITDGHCYDQFNGQIGTQLPITLTDFSAYANAQINTLLGNGGQAVNSAMQVGETGAKAGAMGNAIGVAGAGVGAAALGAVHGAKTVYGLAMNNINKFNQTRGGSSAMLNQYLNQKVTFTFETLELDIPSNFYALNGGATNAGGRIGSFTGYLECDQVKLNIQGATESEKEQIRALLMGGVFI